MCQAGRDSGTLIWGILDPSALHRRHQLRSNPACFLFLVDQSGSMGADIGGQEGARKADQAADAINRIVDTLSQRCSSGMDVRDYFHIGILGYTSVGWLFNGDKPEITSALPGTTPERPFLPISQVVEVAEIEEKRVKEDYGGGEIVEVTRRMPVWLRPHIAKQDPLCGTLRLVERPLVEWISRHPDSYPPIVIIVCDGSSTDGDPGEMAEQIKNLRTNDGKRAAVHRPPLGDESESHSVSQPGTEPALWVFWG